jgi:hypothetical protein
MAGLECDLPCHNMGSDGGSAKDAWPCLDGMSSASRFSMVAHGNNARTTGRERWQRCLFGARELGAAGTAVAAPRTMCPSLSATTEEEGHTHRHVASILAVVVAGQHHRMSEPGLCHGPWDNIASIAFVPANGVEVGPGPARHGSEAQLGVARRAGALAAVVGRTAGARRGGVRKVERGERRRKMT